jgi:hypothetical protein
MKKLPVIDNIAIAKIHGSKGFRPDLLAKALEGLAEMAHHHNAKTGDSTFTWHKGQSEAEYTPYVTIGVKRTKAGDYQARNIHPKGNIRKMTISFTKDKITGVTLHHSPTHRGRPTSQHILREKP